MSQTTANPPFPLFRTILCMVGATVVLGAIAAYLIPTLFPDAVMVEKTVVASSLLIGVLSVVSMVVVAIAAPFGVRALVGAYFASMGIRMIGVLGGAKLMTINEFIPSGKPLAMTLGAIYLPMLMIEVAAIMVFVNRNSTAAAHAGSGSDIPPNASREAGA